MPDLSSNPIVQTEGKSSGVDQAGPSSVVRDYSEWLLRSRAELIRIISANPSLGIQALSTPPLESLPADVLSFAKGLLNKGRIEETVDHLIEATICDVTVELIAICHITVASVRTVN